MRRAGEFRLYTKFTVTTFLPDGKPPKRLDYKAGKGGLLTEHYFAHYLSQHRAILAQHMPDVKFREVQTGPNSWNFIHPSLDRHELAS